MIRIGYRAETGFQCGGTALDVVRYEEEELGNDLHIRPPFRSHLHELLAKDIAWVCMVPEHCLRYGTDIGEIPFSAIIGDDGEGGYLVVVA